MHESPSCGRILRDTPKPKSIEPTLKALQKQLGSKVINLKRDIAAHFGVKRFADLPKEKHSEALEFAKARVEEMTACWAANKVLKEAIPKFLNSLADIQGLSVFFFENALRRRHGDRYWADMEPEQAVDAIRRAVGGVNIWEYTFRPLNATGTE